MAIAFIWSLQDLWPFSVFKNDDLKASNKLVSKLSIPEHTKQFVFAIRDPETQSVIYVLSALNLSERSAFDAECLIKEIKPDAVVVQADNSLTEILSEEDGQEDGVAAPLPTSSFGVIKRCFTDKIGKENYESVAGNFVLRKIFGTSFHGHLVAAKKAAEEIGSSFLVLESSLGKCSSGSPSGEVGAANHFQNFVCSLVPQKGASMASLTLKRFPLSNEVRPQLVKSLSVYMDSQLLGQSPSVAKGDSTEIQPSVHYEAPTFAKSLYPLLEDLHNIFVDLPSIGIALAHVQEMLLDINRGEVLDTRIISQVYQFRVAVEGLRVALNNRGLEPISRKDTSRMANTEFSELPVEEKSYALFANALRCQTDKYKTIVALVDASGLAGLRKHWNTHLPHDVKELVGQLVTNCEVENFDSNQTNRRRSLTEKPMVAVGAGATAVFSASSLSKAVPASTLMKVATLKIPTSLKFLISHTQKAVAFAMGPSKAVVPGIASSGVKTSSVLKATLSAEKIRAVTHSVIASAERTSMSAMRTAFYEIMRKRKIRPVGFMPWATFVGSVGTCSGLLLYGDGIECAVESAPAAPSIASLGRGIEHLRQVSEVAMQTEGTRLQKSIESLINRFKKA